MSEFLVKFIERQGSTCLMVPSQQSLVVYQLINLEWYARILFQKSVQYSQHC